jgi:hypothetical protein
VRPVAAVAAAYLPLLASELLMVVLVHHQLVSTVGTKTAYTKNMKTASRHEGFVYV